MVGPAATRAVAVLTRAPAAGGKRRLFAELGRPSDASLLEALLLDTLDGVADARWRRIVVVEPADACPGVAASVGAGLTVIPQATGPLDYDPCDPWAARPPAPSVAAAVSPAGSVAGTQPASPVGGAPVRNRAL
jgi:hypothetical protein